ncbi:MAG: hypothetical protein Q9169_002386 [Polycauliona sp. 2 TL-2023]
MATADFIIPESPSLVDISIIDSTARVRGIPTETFMVPKIKGYDTIDCPAYSFLIEHQRSGQKVLFDLGVRKDWENLAPKVATAIKEKGWSVAVDKGLVDILKDGEVEPRSINAIIWSHYHWDHSGDPSTFPHSTDLVVGPGFKDAFVPAYPAQEDCAVRESDYANRELREISFDSDLTIGGYKALDYFGDGSFYLLNSPGHAIGHMCALARTTSTPSTFIFLGGDCAHHNGEFRPSPTLPLPTTISPSPLLHLHPNTICPGSLFIPIHRLYDPSARTTATDVPTNQPFFQISPIGAHDVAQCHESVNKMSTFDGRDDVLVMIAHDAHMLDVVTMFPKGKANGWKEEGWKEKGTWKFLKDFEEAVKEREEVGRG